MTKRLKLAEEEVASEAYTVVDPPATGHSAAPVVSPDTGLLQPFRCGAKPGALVRKDTRITRATNIGTGGDEEALGKQSWAGGNCK